MANVREEITQLEIQAKAWDTSKLVCRPGCRLSRQTARSVVKGGALGGFGCSLKGLRGLRRVDVSVPVLQTRQDEGDLPWSSSSTVESPST